MRHRVQFGFEGHGGRRCADSSSHDLGTRRMHQRDRSGPRVEGTAHDGSVHRHSPGDHEHPRRRKSGSGRDARMSRGPHHSLSSAPTAAPVTTRVRPRPRLPTRVSIQGQSRLPGLAPGPWSPTWARTRCAPVRGTADFPDRNAAMSLSARSDLPMCGRYPSPVPRRCHTSSDP